MGKLKLQVQVSLDGFIAGPADEMDWLVMDWDEGLKKYISRLMENVDQILLGRKLAEGFIPYWAGHAGQEGARFMNETHKTVFSKTLTATEWENTDIENGDLRGAVDKLKNKNQKDLIVYGGAGFVSDLVAKGLVDEFHLLVNPTILGAGLPIFKRNKTVQQLEPVNAVAFPCGIVAMHYYKK